MKKLLKVENRKFLQRPLLQSMVLSYAAVWIASAIKPLNRKDWALENVLVFTTLSLLIASYKKTPLSNTSYFLLTLFFMLHSVGAHYTYSEVPLGNWIRDKYHLKRNHYDRVIHFLFGFLLIYPFSELFSRLKNLSDADSRIAAFCTVTFISSTFEIDEAITARVVAPELGDAYLGAQGDEWDAEKDVACAILGAVAAIGFKLYYERDQLA